MTLCPPAAKVWELSDEQIRTRYNYRMDQHERMAERLAGDLRSMRQQDTYERSTSLRREEVKVLLNAYAETLYQIQVVVQAQKTSNGTMISEFHRDAGNPECHFRISFIRWGSWYQLTGRFLPGLREAGFTKWRPIYEAIGIDGLTRWVDEFGEFMPKPPAAIQRHVRVASIDYSGSGGRAPWNPAP